MDRLPVQASPEALCLWRKRERERERERRLLKRCQDLPAGHCVAAVQAVSAVMEPTSRALCCRGAVCLSSVGTYLSGTVLQGCRLLKRCQNLLGRHCVAGVEAGKVVLKPTYWALCCRGEGCLSHV